MFSKIKPAKINQFLLAGCRSYYVVECVDRIGGALFG